MAQSPYGRRGHRTLSMRRRLYAANRRAHEQQTVRLSTLPWFVLTFALATLGVATLTFAVYLAHIGQRLMLDTLIPIGAMLLASSSLPLIIGIVRAVDQPRPTGQHCGRCQFYQASATTYVQGMCTFAGEKHPTTRTASCEHYRFSERAMVRDRFSDAAHILNSPKES